MKGCLLDRNVFSRAGQRCHASKLSHVNKREEALGREDARTVAASLFDHAAGQSFEATASFALAEVLRASLETGAVSPEDREPLEEAQTALGDLWEDLSEHAKEGIGTQVAQAIHQGENPTTLFDEIVRRRGQHVSRAASLASSTTRLNKFLGELGRGAKTILDPACGLGGTLAAVSTPDCSVTGLDRAPMAAAVARLRLALAGINADVEVADALTTPGLPKFDLVVCDPPEGATLERYEVAPHIASRLAEGRLGSVDGNTAWVHFVADHVSKRGLGLVTVPSGFLRGKRQPRKLLESLNARLEAVVPLPSSFGGRNALVLLAISGEADPRKGGRTLLVDAWEENEADEVAALVRAWLRDAREPEDAGDLLNQGALSRRALEGHISAEVATPAAQSKLLTGLELSNFRSFGPTLTEVPLAPLTLVYGENSSGKSSLVQALVVLGQSLVNGCFTADGGDDDWGTWRNLVHGQDPKAVMQLGFSFEDASAGPAGVGSVSLAFNQANAVGGGARTLELMAGDEKVELVDVEGPPVEGPLVQVNDEATSLASRFVYLGPSRKPPRRYSRRGGRAGAENMAFFLANNPSERDQVSLALKKLGVDYELDVVNPIGERYRDSLGEVVSVVLRDRATGLTLSASDAGFGLAQVLPIVTDLSVRTSSVIMVEQPEIHLHPSMQADLADLMIESVDPGGRGNQVIAETHSETLILRVQRRIREQVISHEDVKVLYVERDGGVSRVSELRLNEHGDFLDHWPHGFFDDQFNELFGTL